MLCFRDLLYWNLMLFLQFTVDASEDVINDAKKEKKKGLNQELLLFKYFSGAVLLSSYLCRDKTVIPLLSNSAVFDLQVGICVLEIRLALACKVICLSPVSAVRSGKMILLNKIASRLHAHTHTHAQAHTHTRYMAIMNDFLQRVLLFIVNMS